jgi:hypothetical protein
MVNRQGANAAKAAEADAKDKSRTQASGLGTLDSPVVGVSELAETFQVSERAVRKNGSVHGRYGEPAEPGTHIYLVDRLRPEDRDKIKARREALRRKAAVEALHEVKPVGKICPFGLLDLTEKQAAEAAARRDFILWVERQCKERGLTQAQGCQRAYWEAFENASACSFAMLLTTGKSEGNQITYPMFNAWSVKWNPYRDQRDRTSQHQWWALADRCQGNPRDRAGDERYWNHIALLYECQNGLELSLAWDAACDKGEKLGWGAAPTLRQVRYFYAMKADRAAVKARRLGDKWIYNNLDLTVRRDWSSYKVGDVWFSDHHEFNVFVRIRQGNGWRAVRPWITQFLDAPTFHEVASIIRPRDPDGDVVLDTWRKAVATLGWSAATIYFDNGKDYRSIGGKAGRYVTDLDEKRCETTGKILGVQSVFALPFNARVKPCELDFGITERKFERRWPTYCGHNTERFKILYPTLKAEKLQTYGGAENDPLRGCLVNPELVPTFEEFCAAYYQWRAEVREQMTSDGIMLDGKSPAQAWADGLPQCQRPRLDETTRFVAFLRAVGKPQRVDRGAVVWFKRGESKRDWLRYHSRALEPYLVSGEEVLVKVDVSDISQAYVFRWAERAGWRLIDCGGLHGGCPAVADIAPGTPMEAVRDTLRENRSRRKAIRLGVDAEKQQEALSELARGGSATESEIMLGRGSMREQVTATTQRIDDRKAKRNAVDAILAAEVQEEDTRRYKFGADGDGDVQGPRSKVQGLDESADGGPRSVVAEADESAAVGAAENVNQ